MSPTEKAATVAGRQGGHISWAQLRACGLSRDQIRHRCLTHGWHRVLPQVYRLGGVVDSFEARVAAANLWLGEGGHFRSTTAAYLVGLEGIQRPGRITVARTTAPPAPRWIRVIRLPADDRTRLRSLAGCPVPPVERILLDLATDVSSADAGRALDDALRRGLTTLARLAAVLDEPRRRKGSAPLRTLLSMRDRRDEKVRSQFETRMLRILRELDSVVEADHEVSVAGERFVIDFFLPEVALGIECHSIRWHLGHEAFKKDVRRHRLIASTGIELLFFTWEEVRSAPQRVEAEIRAAVERRRLKPFSK